jgi:hypothetical protein
MMNLLMRSYSEVCLGLIFWLLGFDGLIYCDFDANFCFFEFCKGWSFSAFVSNGKRGILSL